MKKYELSSMLSAMELSLINGSVFDAFQRQPHVIQLKKPRYFLLNFFYSNVLLSLYPVIFLAIFASVFLRRRLQLDILPSL